MSQAPALRDIYHPYVKSVKTDVMATWKRYGFEPPSESQWFQEKWSTYRNLAQINEERTK